jgi:hypothetical protein
MFKKIKSKKSYILVLVLLLIVISAGFGIYYKISNPFGTLHINEENSALVNAIKKYELETNILGVTYNGGVDEDKTSKDFIIKVDLLYFDDKYAYVDIVHSGTVYYKNGAARDDYNEVGADKYPRSAYFIGRYEYRIQNGEYLIVKDFHLSHEFSTDTTIFEAYSRNVVNAIKNDSRYFIPD